MQCVAAIDPPNTTHTAPSSPFSSPGAAGSSVQSPPPPPPITPKIQNLKDPNILLRFYLLKINPILPPSQHIIQNILEENDKSDIETAIHSLTQLKSQLNPTHKPSSKNTLLYIGEAIPILKNRLENYTSPIHSYPDKKTQTKPSQTPNQTKPSEENFTPEDMEIISEHLTQKIPSNISALSALSEQEIQTILGEILCTLKSEPKLDTKPQQSFEKAATFLEEVLYKKNISIKEKIRDNVYKIMTPFVGLKLKTLFPNVTIKGVENIPKDGAIFAIGPHCSHMDTIFILYALWIANNGIFDRGAHPVATEELFKLGFPIKQLLDISGCIPIHRPDRSSASNQTEREAALNQLLSKETINGIKHNKYRIIIWPEGARNREVGIFHKAKKGPWKMQLEVKDRPIVDVSITGAQHVWHPDQGKRHALLSHLANYFAGETPPIEIKFNEPYKVPTDLDPNQSAHQNPIDTCRENWAKNIEENTGFCYSEEYLGKNGASNPSTHKSINS